MILLKGEYTIATLFNPFIKLYSCNGNKIDKFPRFSPEYNTICYIQCEVAYFLERKNLSEKLLDYNIYSYPLTTLDICEVGGVSRTQAKVIAKNLKDSNVFINVIAGKNRGDKTKYEICFKINEKGEPELALRDDSLVKDLFNTSSYISCDDIPEPKKKKRLSKKKTIAELDPTKAEVFEPDMLKEFIERRFKEADIKPKFPLNKKKLNTALKEMCELSGDDIRLLIDCVTSDSYQLSESWEGGKSFTLFVGGALERTLAAAKKWEKSREKLNKRKDRIKELNLKEFEA